MGEGDVTPEVPKKVTTEQKVNTDKTKEPHPDAGKIEELNHQKTTQTLADKTNEGHVREEIGSLTRTSDKNLTESKSEENKELFTFDQEEKKFISRLYGESTDKLQEIITKAGKKAMKENEATGKSVDMDDYSLNALKDINAQLDKYLPQRYSGKLNPDQDNKDQLIPSYMIRIDEKGNATYDPFYKPPFVSSVLHDFSDTLGFGWINKLGTFPDGDIKKPSKAVVKELQDHYTKAKAAEQKSPSNTPK